MRALKTSMGRPRVGIPEAALKDKPHRTRMQVGILAVILAVCLVGWVSMAVNDRRDRDADPFKAERLQRSKESAEMFRQKERAAKEGK